MKRIVAVTGGIGAGKSVVCHVLRVLGYPVYDSDSEARTLMDSDTEMRRRIAREVTPDALNADGSLCRPALAACVFADPAKLQRLNSIVHGAVRTHCSAWTARHKSDTVFIETAILYESGFDSLVTEIWEVTAPEELRIERVMHRNGLDRDAIESRIRAQSALSRENHKPIINDGITPMLPQIMRLLKHD